MREYWRQSSQEGSQTGGGATSGTSAGLLVPFVLLFFLGPIVAFIAPGVMRVLGGASPAMFMALGLLAIACFLIGPLWYLLRVVRWLQYCCRLGWELEQQARIRHEQIVHKGKAATSCEDGSFE